MNNSNYNNHILKQIIPLYFWEPFEQDFSGRQESIKGVIKLILTNILNYFKNYRKIKNYKIPSLEKEFIFCYNGKPKKDVLLNLKLILDDESQICPTPDFIENNEFSDLYFGILGLKYSFHHILWYYSFKGHERRAYRNKFWHCYYDLGKYRYILKQFKKSKKVKCFIGTNDHIGLARIGYVAARKTKIKSVYIQHASVSDKFPPLIMDLALLDGQNAKDKYKIAPDRNVKIELIGSLKYDLALRNPIIKSTSNVVGICVNMFENEQELTVALCKKLTENNIKFIIRFHPHLQEKDISSNFEKNWEYSDTQKENESDFILKCGSIVSGDSSVLLDTIALHRRPIYYTNSKTISDYYGFLKNGVLTKKFIAADDVIDELKKTDFDITSQRDKAKLYVNTFNTPFEGKSTELAIKHLRTLLSDDSF